MYPPESHFSFSFHFINNDLPHKLGGSSYYPAQNKTIYKLIKTYYIKICDRRAVATKSDQEQHEKLHGDNSVANHKAKASFRNDTNCLMIFIFQR